MATEQYQAPRFAGFACHICMNKYSESIVARHPVILPQCGHTICRDCVYQIRNVAKNCNVTCPFDRRSIQMKNPEELLRRNFSLLDVMRQSAEEEARAGNPAPFEAPSSNEAPPSIEAHIKTLLEAPRPCTCSVEAARDVVPYDFVPPVRQDDDLSVFSEPDYELDMSEESDGESDESDESDDSDDDDVRTFAHHSDLSGSEEALRRMFSVETQDSAFFPDN